MNMPFPSPGRPVDRRVEEVVEAVGKAAEMGVKGAPTEAMLLRLVTVRPLRLARGELATWRLKLQWALAEATRARLAARMENCMLDMGGGGGGGGYWKDW